MGLYRPRSNFKLLHLSPKVEMTVVASSKHAAHAMHEAGHGTVRLVESDVWTLERVPVIRPLHPARQTPNGRGRAV